MERLSQLPQVAGDRRVLHREPWILHFDSFISDEDADHLVEIAQGRFERSRATGDDETNNDGTKSKSAYARTSPTSWCNVPECLSDTRFQRIRQRISELTEVPWENSEHLQVLQYEVGQFYTEHHDQIAPRYSIWGPRLYTFFTYLSDVEEGGGTRFTQLNLTVTTPT